MALALSASGVWSSSQSTMSVSNAKHVNSRPRPVHLKAFAPIYQPAPLKSGDLVATSPLGSNAGVEAEIEPLTLANIRESLIRQEDTIIYALLQRAQFSFNGPTYDRNSFAIPGFEGSLVEFMLKETERLHAKVSSSDVRNFCRVFNCRSFAHMYKMPSNSRKSMFIEKRYVRSCFFLIMP
ncbi:hypothetical protein M758_4G162800 [Ceratodon purpureus]|nr:hypothetical protein M758_4G162800 [Ceratodon purpureus]KAG0619760.1 hypothetical protein M758_4G162800 [Ceratodon purpureus]